jgi:hypothetical protein
MSKHLYPGRNPSLTHSRGAEGSQTPRNAAGLFCRPCLDWSERGENSRALTVTAKGRRGFAETLGVSLN